MNLNKRNDEIYSNWIKESCITDLTGNQIKVAKMIIENRKVLINVGNFNDVITSLIKYFRNNSEKLED